jgi:ADP-ribose pyrophosphatase YjhB (NUDIX family)
MFSKGAGVLIVTGSHVLLFRDKKTQEYSDAGGHVDQGESWMQAAVRELLEESIGLFRISRDALSIELAPWPHYRAYVIKVRMNTKMRDIYDANKRDSQDMHVPDQWKETDDVAWVPMDSISKNSVDTLGRTLAISSRALGIVETFMKVPLSLRSKLRTTSLCKKVLTSFVSR